jgi:phosphate transport system protein
MTSKPMLPTEDLREGDRFPGTNPNLDPELRRISADIYNVGQMVGGALGESVDILQQGLEIGLEPLITLDHHLGRRRSTIETDCLSLIAAHQLMGDDLRRIGAMLEILTELQHMSRYVSDNASIHFMIARLDPSLQEIMAQIHQIAGVAQEMLDSALTAFSQLDPAQAHRVHVADDKVDALCDQLNREVLLFMSDKPRRIIKQARYLSQIARNLERTADRVTNLCEWVTFAVTGNVRMADRRPIDSDC